MEKKTGRGAHPLFCFLFSIESIGSRRVFSPLPSFGLVLFSQGQRGQNEKRKRRKGPWTPPFRRGQGTKQQNRERRAERVTHFLPLSLSVMHNGSTEWRGNRKRAPSIPSLSIPPILALPFVRLPLHFAPRLFVFSLTHTHTLSLSSIAMKVAPWVKKEKTRNQKRGSAHHR